MNQEELEYQLNYYKKLVDQLLVRLEKLEIKKKKRTIKIPDIGTAVKLGTKESEDMLNDRASKQKFKESIWEQ
jgi:hypothetical protein